ncbi:type 3 dihydrofolate reductase [Pseudemcibacter aquimaris]|uniref:type 3 dihydrofolate reductase n=1 Tax=Pseudemcibacter aquimaris TaxID=2857064 RepID=UPI00201127D0|nr:type 3 dihydrofolate reductase [Pseudemcibacter aquimaris]MCC3861343.1 type 3 dihydrofolate reductase [Pseudemcibacter aquimaris]WDU58115.1 type 3 dihydrofolate reductase [Pseudemcibacter aquimaris]
MVKVSLIVAAAENRTIGKDNDMPWKISSDLKYFKKVTMNKPVIMGRKTFESIGKPLPGRTNIVITRDTGFTHEGVITAHSVEMALDVAHGMAEMRKEKEIMVIGGAQIYALTLPIADRLYLTRIHAEIEGDAHFPELDEKDWLEYSREDHSRGEKDSHDHSFIVLDRIS